MNRIKLYIAVGLVALVVGSGIEVRSMGLARALQSPIGGGPAVAHGLWAFRGVTVAEQAAEADVIVRARVLNVQVRKYKNMLPTYAEDGKTVIGELADIVPFTDSEMQVLEVYKGVVKDRITVMQTGGNLPTSDGDPPIHWVMDGDPIFEVGSTQILFLKDISGDPIHGQGRNLYVTVNPVGRYVVQGQNVVNHGAKADHAVGAETTRLPQTLDELFGQIRQAVTRPTK